MPDRGDKFTHEEMVALLRRTIARHEREKERVYTTEDLVTAARELDLDPEIVKSAAAEHLARRRVQATAPKPLATRIRLVSDEDRFMLAVPRLPARSAHLAPLGFAIFWLVFVLFWTTSALRASIVFAAFSIPFWLVGFGMLARSGLPLLQTTTIELSPTVGRLRIAPFGSQQHFQLSELKIRTGEQMRWQSNGIAAVTVPHRALLLELGTETHALLAGFSEQERRWVESELGAWLELHRTE